MARAASGRLTAKSVSALAAFAAVLASSTSATSAHAQSRGLLGSPDSLSAPVMQQPAPTDQPAPTPAAGTPGGNTGPGAGGASVTVGGSNTGPISPGQANQPQKDQPGAEKKAQGMTIYDRLAGSSLFVQTGASIGTFFKGYQGDYNPTVATYGIISPRFAISKDWQLRGRIGANFEYPDSDTTAYRHELELTDASLQLFYRGIPALGGKLKLMPFVTAIAPTSKASRSRTMILTPAVGVQAAVPIEHFLGGEAIAIGSFSYGRPFYKQTTPVGLDDRPYQFNCAGGSGNECGGQLSGTMNARDTFSTILIFAATWWKLSPGALMVVSNQVAYKPSSATPTNASGQGTTTARASSYFALWLDAEIADWVTPEIGYQQSRSLLAANGTYGNPFFSNKQDQLLYIGANFQLDSLLKKLVGEEGKAGVVRAKAAPNPIRFY